MIFKSILVIVAITALFCAILYVRTQKPSRRVLVIDPIITSEQVIGDGAWIITDRKFPNSGVLREREPRGL